MADGSLGPFFSAGRQILRRIFVTVRDGDWQEVAPIRWEIDERGSTTHILARHRSDRVDFEWEGKLQVSEDLRELNFDFAGKVVRDMDVCRLGLIVLHPVELIVGARLTAMGPQGAQQVSVSRRIHPQPMVDGVPGAMTEPFSSLFIEREDFGRLELHFFGELFEMEDQRNWGDASFKTYCTPLRLGFPRRVTAGTTISHRVDVRYTPPLSGASVRAAAPPAPSLRPVHGVSRFPELGREWRGSASLDELNAQRWQHVHVDMTDSPFAATLAALLESVTSPKLQVALRVADGETIPTEFLAAVARYPARFARLLIYGPSTSPPSRLTLERCRQAIAAVSGSVPVWAATSGYFVEFNRAIPFDLPVDGIAFPLTATVHSDDAATVNQNVATIRDMADTARELARGRRLALAPLAVRFPPSAGRSLAPPLVASWLVQTLKHATQAGVTGITLADDVIRALTPFSQLKSLIERAGLSLPAREHAS